MSSRACNVNAPYNRIKDLLVEAGLKFADDGDFYLYLPAEPDTPEEDLVGYGYQRLPKSSDDLDSGTCFLILGEPRVSAGDSISVWVRLAKANAIEWVEEGNLWET